MTETMTVAKQLVALCREGKNLEAINTLYSPDVVSIEAGSSSPDMPARMEGIDAIRGKNEWWLNNNEVHSGEAEGPWPNADRFIVRFKYEITSKVGPYAGQRITLDETGLYTVKDGKIAQEEFFYDMGS